MTDLEQLRYPVGRFERLKAPLERGARVDRLNRTARGLSAAGAAAPAAGARLLRVERLRSMSGKHQDHEGEYDRRRDGCS